MDNEINLNSSNTAQMIPRCPGMINMKVFDSVEHEESIINGIFKGGSKRCSAHGQLR